MQAMFNISFYDNHLHRRDKSSAIIIYHGMNDDTRVLARQE